MHLDAYGEPRELREDFAAMGEFDWLREVGAKWLAVLSPLPQDRVRVGATWTRLRRMPDARDAELDMTYRVRAIESGVATIDMHTKQSTTFPAGSDTALVGEVQGATRLRIADGFPLEGEWRMRTFVSRDTGEPRSPEPPGWQFHTRASCVPAPPR
ncbi:MAG: hypothetical protein U0168_12735 [Nannocystaceae bacterium]